ncbi:MAG: hypothetical protein KatS3mg110_2728 [Pirellulaceae bacterium]|nr:MAG: hypothetical protein KatS3mg110_2728 [Pirellulaceae bacterium]
MVFSAPNTGPQRFSSAVGIVTRPPGREQHGHNTVFTQNSASSKYKANRTRLRIFLRRFPAACFGARGEQPLELSGHKGLPSTHLVSTGGDSAQGPSGRRAMGQILLHTADPGNSRSHHPMGVSGDAGDPEANRMLRAYTKTDSHTVYNRTNGGFRIGSKSADSAPTRGAVHGVGDGFPGADRGRRYRAAVRRWCRYVREQAPRAVPRRMVPASSTIGRRKGDSLPRYLWAVTRGLTTPTAIHVFHLSRGIARAVGPPRLTFSSAHARSRPEKTAKRA